MIAVDTSALSAVLLDEEDAARYIEVLKRAPGASMSVASYVELCAVMKQKRGPEAIEVVDRLIEAVGITLEPVTSVQGQIARSAYLRYSVLNFGDVFSYALAKDKNVPLLFKGEDFAQTDVSSCL